MIIADSGFWFGLLDKRDRYHSACRSFINQCDEPLITTFPVLTEALHLLMSRGHAKQGITLLDTLNRLQAANLFCIFPLTGEHLTQVRKLMQQYIDLPMDLADASLVLLAEHLEYGRIVSTDQRDFYTYRWKNRRPFINLLDDHPR